MQYYVIGPDGNRYGPGDVSTLKQWVAEHRLTPQTMLEDFDTGHRMPAASVAGLFEGQQQSYGVSPYANPPSPGPVMYPRGYGYDMGSSELTSSFIWTALGFLCCPVLCPAIGLYYGNQAAKKGNPSAQGARIFAMVVLGLQSVGLVLYAIIVIFAIATGSAPR